MAGSAALTDSRADPAGCVGAGCGVQPVHFEMAWVTGRLEVSPFRISYRTSLLLFRPLGLSAWGEAIGRLLWYLEQLAGNTAMPVLSERRPRSYPRALRIKMTFSPKRVRAGVSSHFQFTDIAVKATPPCEQRLFWSPHSLCSAMIPIPSLFRRTFQLLKGFVHHVLTLLVSSSSEDHGPLQVEGIGSSQNE